MKTEIALAAKGIYKSYKDVKVLRGVDLVIERGKIVALLGPNGSGKTTMVRILSTLIDYQKGSAIVNGYDVKTQADAVRSSIGLTGQYAAVDEYLTGYENLVMMGRLYRLSRKKAKSRADELLAEFDLLKASKRAVKTYSGGMRRRLDLAVSLIASPPIIFLDEPTTGLDPRSRLVMWDIIEKLAAAGTTILLTTQYLDEADRLANTIVVIDGGKVIAEGTANQLKAKVGGERLELTFVSSADLEKAQAIVGKKATTDTANKTISLATTKGANELLDTLSALKKSKVTVESVSLHKPTLDDVFLKLTGHKTQPKAAKTPKKGKK